MNKSTKIAIGTAVGTVTGVGLALAAAPIVGVFGFASAGISAGSVAAGWMSSLAAANGVGVAAGSTFAALQSVGAAGVAASTVAGSGVVAGSFSGGIVALVNRFMGQSDSPTEKCEMVGPMERWGLCLVIISAPDRGLGPELCETIAANLIPGSMIVGILSNDSFLDKTEFRLRQKFPHIKFLLHTYDWHADVHGNLKEILLRATDKFERVILVHNAESVDLNYLEQLEKLHKLEKLHTLDKAEEYLTITDGSVHSLLQLVREMFPGCKQHIVNISSLGHVQSGSLEGRGTRDLLFKVIAEKEPDVDVLNYVPGLFNGTIKGEASGRKRYLKRDAAKTLVTLMESGAYVSGHHVHYYDLAKK